MHLDARLSTIASMIPFGIHADVGSDHGLLLRFLLENQKIERGLAIENKQTPFENSRRALKDLPGEIRLANGLAGIAEGEVDSISISGMGGTLISNILGEFPERIPNCIVLQPNCNPEVVRAWAFGGGYHLIEEELVDRRYTVMRFQRNGCFDDPAYEGLDSEAALLFGPLRIRRWHEELQLQLAEEQQYLSAMNALTPASQTRLSAINRLLERRSYSK